MKRVRPGRSRRRFAMGHALIAFAMLGALAAVPALAATTEYYRDSFASGGFSGSTGTVPWSTPWIESEADGPADGLIQVDNESRCYDGQCLVVGKDDTGNAKVEREMDLSDAITADLTFVYEVHGHGAGAGEVRLQARPQSGSWTTLAIYTLGSDVGPVVASFDLLPYASPATAIRFKVSGSTDDSHLNVDDIEVKWVASTNDPPVLDPVGDKTVLEGTSLGFTATATDPNAGDSLTFSLASSPPAGASMSPAGVFSWTPSEAQGPGAYTFDVVVADDGLPTKSDSETITVTVGEVNTAPVLSGVGDRTAQEGTQLAFAVSATDPDVPANSLSFSLGGGPPSGAFITPSGSFSWTPSETQGPGSYTFDVIVTDDGVPSKSDSETVTVMVNEVNQAPVLSAVGDRSTEQGSTLAFSVSASDPDRPFNTLTYSLEGSVPAGAAIGASSGAFTWSVPASQPPGGYTFDIVVADDGSPKKTDRETITVSVSPVNQPPVLAPVGNRTIDEEKTLTFVADATDPDGPDGDLRFSLAGAPSGAAIGAVSGVFTWTPPEVAGPGSHTFTVIVKDAAGVPKSDQESITVTVREVNRAPVVVSPGPQVVDEGALLEVVIAAADPDLPVNTLVFSLEDAPDGASIDDAGLLTFAPVDGQGDAVYEFDVVVRDDGAPQMTGRGSVTVEVIAVNQPPVIEPIPDQFSEETDEVLLQITVTDPESSAVAVEIVGLPPGLAYDANASAVVGTIAEGAAADSPFEVVVTATDDDPESPVATSLPFRWEVLTANTPPTAIPVILDTEEDTPVTTVLEATDPEGDLVVFSVASPPLNGTVSLDGARAIYRPNQDWNGTDGFTFVAADPRETSEPVRVTVRVAAVNDAPVAIDDAYVAYAGGALEVQAPGILANDVDADGEPLRISVATVTARGHITIGADGGFVYRPEAAFLGSDTFTYRLTDREGATAVGVVTIEVREAVSSGVRTAVVSGATGGGVSPANSDPVRVLERSVVLMSSAARQTVGDFGFPVVLLALVLGLLLSFGRITGSAGRRGAERTGRIDMIDIDAGFGLIRADDDPLETVFFHRSALRPRSSKVKIGDRVVFRSAPGTGRPVATRLRPDTDGGLSRVRSALR